MSGGVSQKQRTPAKQKNPRVQAIRRLIESEYAEQGTIGWKTLTYLLKIGSEELRTELRDFATKPATQRILEVDKRSDHRELSVEAYLASFAIDESLRSVGISIIAKMIPRTLVSTSENRPPL